MLTDQPHRAGIPHNLTLQIKQALAELEKGNKFAFASGKQARQEERQLAQQFK